MSAATQLKGRDTKAVILSNVAFIGGSAILLVLFSSANRPIWYDEMITFTFAGLPDFATALQQVRATTTNLNQGQTGAYLLAEYVSANLLGASWFSMRLPSLLSAVWALAALYVFLRAHRVQPTLIALTPLLCLGYPTLWYFAGEARPYMPLVAAVLGVTAYYSLNLETRSRAMFRVLGWGSVLLGATFHPYFLLYWPAIILFFAVLAVLQQQPQHPIAALWRYANTPLLAIGLSLGILTGTLTWMRGNIEQAVPWNAWLSDPLPQELVTSLCWPFAESGLLGVLGAVILVGVVITTLIYRGAKNLIPPLALMALAVALALIVSAASVLSEFWVFPRQWVASQALIIAALVWLCSEVLKAAKVQRTRRIPSIGLLVVLLALLPGVVTTALWKASDLRRWSSESSVSPYTPLELTSLTEELDSAAFPSDRRWAEFAQANLIQGGEVWPELGRYYLDTDWKTITLEFKSRSDLFLD